MKIASIYERNESWYFQPSSKTTNGLWVASSPLLSVDRKDSPQRKSEMAFEVLNTSTDSVPIPTDPNALVSPLLELANVKSWATFMKDAKCISLELEDGQLAIIPQRKLKRPKGALESLPEEAIIVSADASPDSIGSALEEAIGRSE